MHRPFQGAMLLFQAVVLAVSVFSGCAKQQPPINRIEAYALPKSLFNGEWYYGQTVVDVPGTLTVTMVGNTNYQGTYRIRWDIQENYLYARKAYEAVEGAKNTNPDSGEYKGTIVGSWKIVSHFDIKRAYNPTTGEENNVLTENAEDCKWYDCKYLRVDWSTNLAIDYLFLDGEENMKKEPIPFFDQDAHDPRWSPIFDLKKGYIDFTTAIALTPGSVHLPQYNVTIPLCWWQ